MPCVTLTIIFFILLRMDFSSSMRVVGTSTAGVIAPERASTGLDVGPPAAESSAEANGRPWWQATSSADRHGRGALRSAKLRLERGCRLSSNPLSLVLDFVPLRSYFVAAAAPRQSEINIWEVITSPGHVLGRARAVFVRRLVPGTCGGFVRSFWFAPNSALLVADTGHGCVGLWDVRTGEQVAQLDGGTVVGVSPRGDVAVGTVVVDGTSMLAIWEISTGVDGPQVIDVASGATGLEGVCVHSAFPAEGNTLAVLLGHMGDQSRHLHWSVYILNSTSRELLCSREVFSIEVGDDGGDGAPRRFTTGHGFGLRLFAWDGARLLVRPESSRSTMIFRLRHTNTGYELVFTLWADSFEDVNLSSGLALHVSRREASIIKLRDGPGVQTLHTTGPLAGDRLTTGSFSPDGKKALLAFGIGLEHGVWDFASECPPERLSMESPVFSPDSAALVGGIVGLTLRPDLVVRPLDGSQVVYLEQGFGPSMLAVSGLAGCC